MREMSFEQLLAGWLAEGPLAPPPAPVDAAIAHARTHAPRAARPAWWRFPMGATRDLTPVPAWRPALSWGWILVVAMVTLAVVGLLVAGGRPDVSPNPAPASQPAVIPGDPSPRASATSEATPSPTPTPAWTAPPASDAPGLLAVSVDGEIVAFAPGSSTAPRSLTATAGLQEIVGALSPDGSWLAYWVVRTPADGGMARQDYDLWRMRVDGTGAASVLPNLDLSAPLRPHLAVSWAPDGTAIALTHYAGYAVPAATLLGTEHGLRQVPVAGSPSTRGRGNGNPVFSPDGSRVAFAGVGDFGVDGRGLFLMSGDPDGTDRPVSLDATSAAGEVQRESVGWVDDSVLAFVADGSLWTIDADGTDLARATPREMAVLRAAPAPGGLHIAIVVTGAAADGADLYVLSTGGTTTAAGRFPAALVHVGGLCRPLGTQTAPLAWAPDGRWVGFLAAGPGGACMPAWIAVPPDEAIGGAWSTPSFFNPRIWDQPFEMTPIVRDDVVGTITGLSWGPSAP